MGLSICFVPWQAAYVYMALLLRIILSDVFKREVQVKGTASPLAALSLRTKLAPAAFQKHLKAAWIALRFHAPSVATKIFVTGDSYEFEYITPKNAEEVDEWVAHTLLEKPSCNVSQDLVFNLINDGKEREKYNPDYAGYSCGLYFAPGKLQGQYHICLFNQHAAIDGRGALLALDILLKHLGSPQIAARWGEEVKRLPLPVSYATGLRKDGDVAPEGFNDLMQAMQDHQSQHQVSFRCAQFANNAHSQI